MTTAAILKRIVRLEEKLNDTRTDDRELSAELRARLDEIYGKPCKYVGIVHKGQAAIIDTGVPRTPGEPLEKEQEL